MNNYCVRLHSLWNQYRFLLGEFAKHKALEIGRRNVFHVPVRSSGSGALIIGQRNAFGYGPAPRVGSGEVLLQPRRRGSQVVIGDENYFSNNVSVIANESVVIGDRCLIGDGVGIYDCDFHEISPRDRRTSCGPVAPVRIGNNVWLGSRVLVLKGVTIGDNSVIGAMSLVTKSIPENTLAAGVPAKMLRDIG